MRFIGLKMYKDSDKLVMINFDRVTAMYEYRGQTNLQFGRSDDDWVIHQPMEEVLDILGNYE